MADEIKQETIGSQIFFATGVDAVACRACVRIASRQQTRWRLPTETRRQDESSALLARMDKALEASRGLEVLP